MSAKRGLACVPPPGSIVRLTGYFLRATGQLTGTEGVARWRTLGKGECGIPKCPTCDGGFDGSYVAVDEERSGCCKGPDGEWRYEGYEDIASTREDGRLMRHIAIANLELVGAPPRAADQADEVGPIAARHVTRKRKVRA